MNVNWSAWVAFIVLAIVCTIVYMRTREGTIANRISWWLAWTGLFAAILVLLRAIF
jgi:uncharacterized membrane protein